MAFEHEESNGSTIIRAVRKHRFDFSGIGSTGGVISVVGAKNVDVSPYRLIHVVSRFHYDDGLSGGVTWVSGMKATISVRADAPTPDDPTDFVGTSDLGST